MYQVPKNISARFEFFPGFGWKELFFVLTGLLTGFIFYLVLGIFTKSFIRYLVIFVPAGLSYFLSVPGPDGNSVISLIKYYLKWSKKQKRYLYGRYVDA
ncbi:PrgI family mobile element protein [Thermosediminibacter litoriperuensis]|uniref:PrgI family protein n=1 Tax=Thermosediminibacter litoriperuensis TaxID=291989 RepID=A0A5S5AVT7_9FIRM|nr:PrgI family protein [Thermosediminibacter litoriperuensis]TYP56838.1 PrgI family protein [Thermosediminibacter litoriperuensis]